MGGGTAGRGTPVATSDPLPRGTETVLLVEDQAPLRRVLTELLQGFGYVVVETGDPREAVRLADAYTRPIDLLLTDVVMPGMTGPQLALQLVSVRPRLRVLYMSGFIDKPALESAERAALVLQKPFTAETLAKRVRDVLDEPA